MLKCVRLTLLLTPLALLQLGSVLLVALAPDVGTLTTGVVLSLCFAVCLVGCAVVNLALSYREAHTTYVRETAAVVRVDLSDAKPMRDKFDHLLLLGSVPSEEEEEDEAVETQPQPSFSPSSPQQAAKAAQQEGYTSALHDVRDHIANTEANAQELPLDGRPAFVLRALRDAIRNALVSEHPQLRS